MEIIVKLSIGVVLGCLMAQKELQQLYQEYKDSKGDDSL